MERPLDKQESIEKYLAQRAAMKAAATRSAGSRSDAAILRQLAVFAYPVQRETASADVEEGSDT